DHLIKDLHQKGRVAVHCLPEISTIYDRLDTIPIIGNLREDGGSELDRKEWDKKNGKYTLCPIISATILPPANYSYGQEFYAQFSSFFLLINVENTVVKDYGHTDLQSRYVSFWGHRFLNKRERTTYKALNFTPFQSWLG